MPHIWALERGATLLADNAVRFAVWAPYAGEPLVRVCSGPARGDHRLLPHPTEHGVFTATIPGVGVGADYGFVLQGGGPVLPDPVSRWQPNGVHGPSRVVDPAAFRWTDEYWHGLAMADLIIYELHVGTFTDEGTFAAAISHLRDLKALGISAIEIMPVAQFPGDRNWGYDGVGLYAPQNTYGGPEGLKQLVDAAHEARLAVILDVVYNHLGPEGNYLDAFGQYFTEKYKTPWGRALNYDDAHSDEVRRFVIENALYWVTEYHVDGLRLDAVHGIFDFSVRHLVAEIGDGVHTQAALLNRSAVVIGESDLNDPRVVRRADEHGYGLDAQWSDDFHHAVHAALTGEMGGYYADYGKVETVARALEEPFVLAGDFSTHRKRKHGAPSTGIPRERFVVAIQNHDQVGNRAAGERLSTLLEPPQLRLAIALLLLSPYIPLIFMGDEYGETNPFLYFVSHGDAQLVQSVRKGRQEEFASFNWTGDIPDPAAQETFAQCRLDRSKITAPPHDQVLALYRDLLALRFEEPLLRPDASYASVRHGEPGWITLLRESRDGRDPALLACFNITATPLDIPLPSRFEHPWLLRLSTDAAGYGGTDAVPSHISGATSASDEPKRLLGAAAERTVRLPPWTAALFAAL